MPDTSLRLDLPYIQPAQAQKHVTHNEALRLLDALVQLRLDGIGEITPPASPEPGETHALGAGATGAWAGQDGNLAVWAGDLWQVITPQDGWLAIETASSRAHVFSAGGWHPAPGATQNTDGLGIATSWDATNRLAVASEAILFSHAGAGHQLKINKAGPGDTASLLYQTGWSGRAEMGLAGNDDFAIKLSPDGSSWTTALALDATTGLATGAAVQTAANDITPGRLARADYAYGPGNLLGSVSQSAGVPTGAVIERGTNANGKYVRFADGTQICWSSDLNFGSVIADGSGTFGNPWRTNPLSPIWPAAFSAPPTANITFTPSDSVNAGPLECRGYTPALFLPPTATGWPFIRVARLGSNNTATTIIGHVIAIGRWF